MQNYIFLPETEDNRFNYSLAKLNLANISIQYSLIMASTHKIFA